MRFVLLIYSNQASWEALSPAERIELGQGHAALHESLTESGGLAIGAGLTCLGERERLRWAPTRQAVSACHGRTALSSPDARKPGRGTGQAGTRKDGAERRWQRS
jgi:hypothetical protein